MAKVIAPGPAGLKFWRRSAEFDARTADAWNVWDKTAGVTLSNSDKTATFTTGPNASVRSTTKHTSGTAGKYYAEILCVNVVESTGNESIGLHNANVAFPAASSSNRVLLVNGNIQTYGGVITGVSLGALVDGDTLCIAWDAGAELIWFRRNNGLWNNNGSAILRVVLAVLTHQLRLTLIMLFGLLLLVLPSLRYSPSALRLPSSPTLSQPVSPRGWTRWCWKPRVRVSYPDRKQRSVERVM